MNAREVRLIGIIWVALATALTGRANTIRPWDAAWAAAPANPAAADCIAIVLHIEVNGGPSDGASDSALVGSDPWQDIRHADWAFRIRRTAAALRSPQAPASFSREFADLTLVCERDAAWIAARPEIRLWRAEKRRPRYTLSAGWDRWRNTGFAGTVLPVGLLDGVLAKR